MMVVCGRVVEVVGCPDVRAPPGGWAVRNDDSTSTLGCNHHDDVMVKSRTWQLVCVGHAWRGVTHNCTTTPYQHGSVPTVITSSSQFVYCMLLYGSNVHHVQLTYSLRPNRRQSLFIIQAITEID